MAGGTGYWIVFNKQESTIDTFLEEKSPSKISSTDGFPWIYIRRDESRRAIEDENKVDDDDTGDEEGLDSTLDDSGVSIENANDERQLQTYMSTNGKWLIFASTGDKLDNIWRDVGRATFEGKLGCGSKVSTCKPDGKKSHVICVYNSDYNDMEKVCKVEKGIRSLGIGGKLFYKPDDYTHLGIYSGSSIKPYIYTSKFDDTLQQYVVKSVQDELDEEGPSTKRKKRKRRNLKPEDKSQTKITKFFKKKDLESSPPPSSLGEAPPTSE